MSQSYYNTPAVKLSPDICAASFRRKNTRELALWYILRALNVTGSGVINIDEYYVKIAEVFHISGYSARRLLRLGSNKVFEYGLSSKQRAVIKIYGLKRVCEYLNITRIDFRHWHLLPADRFNSLGRCRAEMYASIHRPAGIQAAPMSRATLTELTGLAKTTMRRFEKQAGVKRTPNFAPKLKQPIFTKARGHRSIVKRLGNSYHTTQKPGAKGMLPKAAKALSGKRSSISGEAQLPLDKLYFPSARRAVKANNGHPGILRYFIIPNTKRTIPGRLEWEPVICLC